VLERRKISPQSREFVKRNRGSQSRRVDSKGMKLDHVREYHCLPMDTEHGAKLAALTLIFLDLQVRQPVRVFRCVFRAEGLVFMPVWWSIAARGSAPSRNLQEGAPEFAGQAGQLPAFESESQYGVRVLVRQRAGEALRIVMAAWSDGEETGLRTLVRSYKTRGRFETDTVARLAQELIFLASPAHLLATSSAQSLR
jgi:hypothetical protein